MLLSLNKIILIYLMFTNPREYGIISHSGKFAAVAFLYLSDNIFTLLIYRQKRVAECTKLMKNVAYLEYGHL